MPARTRAFIDTNIFIYIQRTDEPEKTKLAEKTIDFFDCVVSTQVLNEIGNILTKKFSSPREEVIRVFDSIKEICTVITITNDFPEKALDYHYRYSISYYDALIVTAAIEEILLQLNEYFSDEYLFELNADKITKNTESWVHLTGKRSRSNTVTDILSGFSR